MKETIKFQIGLWFCFFTAIKPILNLTTKVFSIPPDFNVYSIFGLLVVTAIVSFYGTSMILNRLPSKNLKGFYYSIALLTGSATVYFIVTNNTRSSVNELKWLLFLYDTIVFTAFSIVAFYQRQINAKNNDIRLELSKAQLSLLRSQINPHFLYNTLHNIDSLIAHEPTKASSAVIKLSDIMRYMMKDIQNERVKLTDEVEYLSNYIELERLRLKKDTFVRFQVSGVLDGLDIAPMLLIPFVENAFKHSVSLDRDNSIDIQLLIAGSILCFTCQNYFNPMDTEKDTTHGIGLETVRKRLELIYPKAHTLSILKENQVFRIELELHLNAH